LVDREGNVSIPGQNVEADIRKLLGLPAEL